MSGIAQHINRSDLTKFVHYVLFENNTSGTSILDIKKIQLIELNDDGVILCVPKASCQEKHNLTLYLYYLPLKVAVKNSNDLKNKKNSFISVIGIVRTKEDSEDDKMAYIKVDFTQFNEYQWEQFVLSYEERQKYLNTVSIKSKE